MTSGKSKWRVCTEARSYATEVSFWQCSSKLCRLETVIITLKHMEESVGDFVASFNQQATRSQELASFLRHAASVQASRGVELVHGTGDGTHASTKTHSDMDSFVHTSMNLKITVLRSCERVLVERLLRPVQGLLTKVDTIKHLFEKRRRYQTDVDAYKRKVDVSRSKAMKTSSAADHSDLTRQTTKLRDAKDRFEEVDEAAAAAISSIESSIAALTVDAFHTQLAVTYHMHSFAADAFGAHLPSVPETATPLVQLAKYTKQAAANEVQDAAGQSQSHGGLSSHITTPGGSPPSPLFASSGAASDAQRLRAGFAFPSLAAANAGVARGESLPAHLWGTDPASATLRAPGRLPASSGLKTLHSVLHDPQTTLSVMESGGTAAYSGDATVQSTAADAPPAPFEGDASPYAADSPPAPLEGDTSPYAATYSPPAQGSEGGSGTPGPDDETWAMPNSAEEAAPLYGGLLVRASFDFHSGEEGDLVMGEGDIVEVTEMEGDWWAGVVVFPARDVGGVPAASRFRTAGVFPQNYVVEWRQGEESP